MLLGGKGFLARLLENDEPTGLAGVERTALSTPEELPKPAWSHLHLHLLILWESIRDWFWPLEEQCVFRRVEIFHSSFPLTRFYPFLSHFKNHICLNFFFPFRLLLEIKLGQSK